MRADQHHEHPLELSYTWLRDHCRCAQCTHESTRQRLQNTQHIPSDVHAAHVTLSTDGARVHIVWAHDKHESVFDVEWLSRLAAHHKLLHKQRDEHDDGGLVLWRGQLDRHGREMKLRHSYEAVCADRNALASWLKCIRVHGMAFLDGVEPTVEGTTKALKMLGPIMNTFYGDVWYFGADVMQHNDTAYTTLALPAHTDSTYFEQPAGLQSLHCVEYKATGGGSFLVDGFQIAQDLRRTHRDTFDWLTRTPLAFRYVDMAESRHIMARKPVIELDDGGRVVSFRYNNCDRAPQLLGGTIAEQNEAYKHLQRLIAAVNDPARRYRYLMQPGTLVTFNNTRVMHARESFVGRRMLVGCYHAADDWQGTLRALLDEYPV